MANAQVNIIQGIIWLRDTYSMLNEIMWLAGLEKTLRRNLLKKITFELCDALFMKLNTVLKENISTLLSRMAMY